MSLQLDSNIIRPFGNLTAVGTAEVLVCGRTYAEPAAQAQRSLVSTSAQDANPGGTGAKGVHVDYLDSNYVAHSEDILLNGLTPVNTTNLDWRFIQRMYVNKGAAAVGAVKIMTAVAGGGTEITGIGSGALDAFLCHHYVAAGKMGFLLSWEATVNLNCNMKLTGQWRPNGVDLVDQTIDLDNLTGPGVVTAGRANFSRDFDYVQLPEKTYVRVTTVPGVAGAIIRAYLGIYEP